VVDRSDRRRLMVAVGIIRAAVIAGLAAAVLAHADSLLLIYIAAFVTGVGSAPRNTAAVASVPRLVSDPADLDRANARVIAGQIVGNERRTRCWAGSAASTAPPRGAQKRLAPYAAAHSPPRSGSGPP
jgi:hypothetical protein